MGEKCIPARGVAQVYHPKRNPIEIFPLDGYSLNSDPTPVFGELLLTEPTYRDELLSALHNIFAGKNANISRNGYIRLNGEVSVELREHTSTRQGKFQDDNEKRIHINLQPQRETTRATNFLSKQQQRRLYVAT